MPYYDFEPKDILKNTLKTHPEYKFDIWSGSVFVNNRGAISGAYVNNVTMVNTGDISLYELNIDRDSSAHTYNPSLDTGNKSLIFPFITKDGSFNSIGTITNAAYNVSFQYGSIFTGSYPLSASIHRENFITGHGDSVTSHISALKNTLNYYTYLSPHYEYSSKHGNKAQQEINLISIPSIFFDSGIKPGTVDLKFYISGTLVAQAKDKNKNGELIQVSGTTFAQTSGSNKVAGVVLYNEGFVVLTGSWNLTEAVYDFGQAGSDRKGQWNDFAAGANDAADSSLTLSASFQLKFEGTNNISTLTMHAIAPKGHLNYSSNPTYKLYESASLSASSGLYHYSEASTIPIKNTVSSSFCDYSASFKKQTFIGKIGIYDDQRNLIAVANLATPVKKTEDRSLTFKLKLDI